MEIKLGKGGTSPPAGCLAMIEGKPNGGPSLHVKDFGGHVQKEDKRQLLGGQICMQRGGGQEPGGEVCMSKSTKCLKV